VYVDPVQRRARWKLVAVGVQKKLKNGRRATKPTWRRSAETAKKLKKHINRQKSNIAKHQNKNGMEKAGDEEKEQGHQV
jgi:hypothetical protein